MISEKLLDEYIEIVHQDYHYEFKSRQEALEAAQNLTDFFENLVYGEEATGEELGFSRNQKRPKC